MYLSDDLLTGLSFFLPFISLSVYLFNHWVVYFCFNYLFINLFVYLFIFNSCIYLFIILGQAICIGNLFVSVLLSFLFPFFSIYLFIFSSPFCLSVYLFPFYLSTLKFHFFTRNSSLFSEQTTHVLCFQREKKRKEKSILPRVCAQKTGIQKKKAGSPLVSPNKALLLFPKAPSFFRIFHINAPTPSIVRAKQLPVVIAFWIQRNEISLK